MQIASNDDIHSVAETALNSALSSADYGEAGERLIYGNLAGMWLLEEGYDMMQRMKRFEEKMGARDARQQNLDAQITDLQHHVKALTLASEEYRESRHRFLDVYRRDILNDVDEQGRQKIGESTEVAHNGDAVTDASLYTFGERFDVQISGDAVADASLYTSGERLDETVLVDLYGLTATQISLLGKRQTSLSKLT
jgi:hypothetical protein